MTFFFLMELKEDCHMCTYSFITQSIVLCTGSPARKPVNIKNVKEATNSLPRAHSEDKCHCKMASLAAVPVALVAMQANMARCPAKDN
jgi:hypothetical protein